MGNSTSSQGSSTGTHEGDVGTSILEEQHDWPIEQAADIVDTQSLQEMQNPYIYVKCMQIEMKYLLLLKSFNVLVFIL